MSIDENMLQKVFYKPFMNHNEIDRIFNVKNGNDYLLKLRADTVADHMRLFRVYRNRALIFGEGWSFEESFYLKPYEMFLNSLNEKDKKECLKLTYGNIFSNDANGYIMNSVYGPIITVSDSLSYFFKFMNLALLVHDEEVPDHVCKNAIRIAVRVMLKTETLDFLMDPRGMVTEVMSYNMHLPINYEYMTIIGHEFAHYLHGDLENSKCVNKPIFHAISKEDEDYNNIKVFSHSQQQEFDADLLSLKLPNLDDDEYKKLFEATLLWFMSLSIYEEVTKLMFPVSSWAPKSHPTAFERINNILTNSKIPIGFDLDKFESAQKTVKYYQEWIVDDVNANLESYEMYGSVYFDKPNTEWRGEALVDRVDYY